MPENSTYPFVHEIAASHASGAFSTFLQDRLSQLAGEGEARVSIEIDEAAAAAGDKSRLAGREEINPPNRPLRQWPATGETSARLPDATSSYFGPAAAVWGSGNHG